MKKLGLLVVGIVLTTMAFSQTANPELVSSGGDSFSNTTYLLDWSIGECVTATHSEGDYVITQGFYQEGDIITSVEEFTEQGININIYPNPTTNFVELKTGSPEIENMQYSVTDINGKILQNEEVTNETEQLNFSNYSNGVYFLTITQENQVIKSFKIIKN